MAIWPCGRMAAILSPLACSFVCSFFCFAGYGLAWLDCAGSLSFRTSLFLFFMSQYNTIQYDTIRYNTIQYVLPATASSSSSIHCVRAERWWWIFCQRRHLSQLCCWSVTVLSLLVVLTIDDRHSLFSPFYLCTCTCRPNHGCANRGCDHSSKYWLFQRPLVHPVRTCQLLSDQRLHWYVSSWSLLLACVHQFMSA